MKKVKEMYYDCIGYESRFYDFYERDDWEIPFERTDEEIGNEEYIPMMNYLYPLPEEFEQDTKDKDLKKLVNQMSCLTIAYLPEEDSYFLALTGGGMDLSWEICEAYMVLGYLPPVYFCGLPAMADKKWDARTRRIISACQRSLRGQRDQNERGLKRLTNLIKGLKEENVKK